MKDFLFILGPMDGKKLPVPYGNMSATVQETEYHRIEVAYNVCIFAPLGISEEQAVRELLFWYQKSPA